ncbi:MAG: response regulator [Anaerolineaceae bacterium]|nr:response regulator [Anaerolineaceae bacterium]
MPEQEKIRVLIVDDIDETRENIRRLLQFDQAIEVVGTANNGTEGIKQAALLKPDVIVMDINMNDMDGIAATEAIRNKVPYAQVIILSVQGDPSYMRRAMLAGARDFLTKPPSIDELTSAINRAGEMAIQEKGKVASVYAAASDGGGGGAEGSSSYGKIITVYSPKGGVGKTTLAVNLALSLLSNNQKVLLVDGCLQFGDTAVFVNEPVKNSLVDLTPRVDDLDLEVVNEALTNHSTSDLQILAAPSRPEMAFNVDPEQFTKLITYLRKHFKYIIIDTNSYLTEVVQASLEISDVIILISTQDISSIKSSNSFLTLMDATGISRQTILFTLNQYDRRIAITPERVGESLKQEVVVTIPFEERVVSSSINRGIPFILENKNLMISKAIFQLADAVKDRIKQIHEMQDEEAI